MSDMNKQNLYFDTVIIGLGLTGLSCARYLAGKGVNIAITDSRKIPPQLGTLQRELPDIPLFLGNINMDLLSAAGQLVVSPGVSIHESPVKDAIASGIPIVSDIELFCQNVTAPIVAITGSNGKSTVTTLLAQMAEYAGLEIRAGGNLGTPALDLIGEVEPDLYVLELSSFQLEMVHSLNAKAAVILNISADHLDRYPSINDYAVAKQRIYEGDGTMVINRDDKFVSGMLVPHRNIIKFTLNEPEDSEFGLRVINDSNWLVHDDKTLISESELQIHGEHNLANALAALALGSAIDIPMPFMLDTLREFSGLSHRCQWVGQFNLVDWYNDSKGTNVGACIASVKGIGRVNNVVLIAGGVGKSADFSELVEIAKEKLSAAVLIGVDAPKIEDALSNTVPVYRADDMGMAVRTAANIAKPGDVVLLSPACASFDMYEDYKERGNAFMAEVNKLAE
jgi:UDP-N-acetylmuramoylalanine--D-glutamate ligase